MIGNETSMSLRKPAAVYAAVPRNRCDDNANVDEDIESGDMQSGEGRPRSQHVSVHRKLNNNFIVNVHAAKRANRIRIIAAGVGLFIIILLVTLTAGLLPKSADPASELTTSTALIMNPQFLHFSDFHLDLLYDPTFSADDQCFCNNPSVYGNTTNVSDSSCMLTQNKQSDLSLGRHNCDSPEALVNWTLMKAHEILPDPDFILITGDYVRHNTDLLFGNGEEERIEFILNTIDRIGELVRAFFPSTATHHAVEPFYEDAESDIWVVNVLGNNDLDGDYMLPIPTNETESPWLARVAPSFFSSLQENESVSFRRGGYFVQEVVPGLHIISLNTVIYSPHHRPSNVTLDDPFGQFNWLETTLLNFQTEVYSDIVSNFLGVYLVGHIPPTIDQYGFSLQWEERFAKRYYEIADTYKDIIKAHLYGHVHCNAFRIITLPNSQTEVPIFVTTAVTPVYQNNPGFRIWEYGSLATLAAGELLKFTAYAMLLDDVEDTFNKVSADITVAKSSVSISDLVQIADSLLIDDEAWYDFVNQLWADNTSDTIQNYKDDWEFRVHSYCGIWHWKNSTFSECVKLYKNNNTL